MAATKLDLLENRRSELQAAFLAFGSVSEQLSGAFDSLRAQVAQLRLELGEAHAGKEHMAARLPRSSRACRAGFWYSMQRVGFWNAIRQPLELLGEPLLAQAFAAVLARATVNGGAVGEHTELRSGDS